MPEPRVALYFDFDNIIISRYDQLFGDSAYRKDTGRRTTTPAAETEKRLAAATVDLDAVLDFAATFGTIAISRAYADWSTPINASYRGALIDRAVDLVQLFPLTKGMKNGADIRLAVDAVEDMFRVEDLTHIVIVAGDSDYVALAQKAKRLGRYVVGIGVAGGTSRALTAACDEFADYDALLSTDAATSADLRAAASAEPADSGEPVKAAPKRRSRAKAKPVTDAATSAEPNAEGAAAESTSADDPASADTDATAEKAPASRSSRSRSSAAAKKKAAETAASGEGSSDAVANASIESTPTPEPEGAAEPEKKPTTRSRRATSASIAAAAEKAAAEESANAASASSDDDLDDEPDAGATSNPRNPGRLLVKALELMRAKNDDDWQPSGAVKSQMRRMDPSFQERKLGFGSFTDFLKSQGEVIELDESGQNRVRIRPFAPRG